MLYDRLMGSNKPANWSATHDNAPNSGNYLWRKWRIPAQGLADMLYFRAVGDITNQQFLQSFDFTDNTQAQMLEVFNNLMAGLPDPVVTTVDKATLSQRVYDMIAILRLTELGVPQQHVINLKNFLYNRLGVTEPDV